MAAAPLRLTELEQFALLHALQRGRLIHGDCHLNTVRSLARKQLVDLSEWREWGINQRYRGDCAYVDWEARPLAAAYELLAEIQAQQLRMAT